PSLRSWSSRSSSSRPSSAVSRHRVATAIRALPPSSPPDSARSETFLADSFRVTRETSTFGPEDSMRAWSTLCAVALSVALAAPAAAEDAEALKRELDALRKQIESLTQRLQKLEATPPPPASSSTPSPAPVAAPAPPTPSAPATTAGSAPSPTAPVSIQD